ncbi:MAG: hypothetical protein KAI67_01755 [Candidatus Pacebacteria bacterium]|nr:hypothetical protein [Candidatus Paceibacterota bacterium]
MLESENIRLSIYDDILNEIDKRKDENRAFILGINGIDGSGKTEFSLSFEKYLLSKKRKIQIIHIDDFCNPKSIRYAGDDLIYNCFHKTFDINLVVRSLLIPIQRNKELNIELTLLNTTTDKYDVKRKFIINKNTIIIFEGVYVFRDEFISYLDYKIFLDISIKECRKRIEKRDGEETVEKLNNKYLPAQSKYIEEVSPSEVADLVIDNSNWNLPKIRQK